MDISASVHRRSGDRFSSLFVTYASAVFVNSGPWLIALGSVAGVAWMLSMHIAGAQQSTGFEVLIAYAFCVSLIATGPVQAVTGRAIADCIYVNDRQSVLSLTVRGMSASALIALAVMFVYLLLVNALPRQVWVASTVALVSLSVAWSATNALQTVRAYYVTLVVSFVGYAIFVGLAWLWADGSLVRALLAFGFGQSAIAVGAMLGLLFAFPSDVQSMPQLVSGASSHVGSLALFGVLNYGALWVDKFLFWAHPHAGSTVIGSLRVSYMYDLPMLLAYLTIIPAASVLLLVLNNEVDEATRLYCESVNSGSTLREIESRFQSLVDSARHTVTRVVRTQIMVTLLVVVFTPTLIKLSNVDLLQEKLLYVDFVAVAAQSVYITVIALLLWLDRHRAAAGLAGFFCIANAVGTWWTLQIGSSAYGLGCAGASVVASVVGVGLVTRVFSTYVRDTFAGKQWWM